MLFRIILKLVVTVLVAGAPAAGQTVARLMDQDPTRNNLVDPPGYITERLGSLGSVSRSGSGSRPMILIPGLGFGEQVFENFLPGLEAHFTRYAVTLPGMSGTPAPPSPPRAESFGEQRWTMAAVEAVEELMEEEGLEDIVLVGHWLVGTQVALHLALRHPDRVSALVLVAGSARWVTAEPDPLRPDDVPLAERVAGIDEYMAPQWFKTVTRETWDDNNFLPGDYAVHPVLGLRLWREAARPPLHAWVRYLNEFFAQDATLLLDELEVPTLLLKPGLEGIFHEPGNNYVHAYLHRGWGRWGDGAGAVQSHTVLDSRIVPWADQPEMVEEAVADFLSLSPLDTAETTWLFRDIRVFDGSEVHEGLDVLVRGGSIEAVGTDLSALEDARIVEGEGHTLLPGLIDGHTHTMWPQLLDGAARFGVTTVLDQFTLPSTIQQIREAPPGLRASFFTSGIAATAPGGHPANRATGIPTLSTPEEATAFVRQRIGEGSQWVKIVWDDGATHGVSLPALDSVTVIALIDAAHAAGVKAVVHVATERTALAAVAAGADGLVHTIQDARVSEDFGRLVAASGAFVVPTLTVIRSTSGAAEGAIQLADPVLAEWVTGTEASSLEQSLTPRPGARSDLDVAMRSVQLLHEAGVPLIVGSDAPNPGTAFGVTVHREMELLVEAGLSATEALAAATYQPARAFDLDDRGAIAPGLRADLLMVRGDPSRNILATRQVAGVWIGGKRVPGTEAPR